jgi:RNA polymerase sigma factor (sigma-70 family)
MVFRTCRRLLPTLQDAEDATQAVFLFLAQKPEKAPANLAGWLHQVARNTALMVLRTATNRARREERAAQMRVSAAVPKETGLREELDAALDRLPESLRTAVILCHLEGRNQDEAARIAGCNQGTLSRRAADGLERLRAILARRATVVTPVLLAGFLAQEASAGLPASLADLLATPKLLAAGALTTKSAAALLANGLTKAMFWAKLKLYGLIMASVAVVAVPAYVILKPATEPTGFMGETNILSSDDSDNANLLLAQQATLAQPGTLQSLSFYVTQAAGSLRLGLYDASGPGGGPGKLLAQTNAFTPVVGWNTAAVVSPAPLAAGTYWLAYLPSDNNLHFAKDRTSGSFAAYSFPFGPMPATFSTTAGRQTAHWSFYATLTMNTTSVPSVPTGLSK